MEKKDYMKMDAAIVGNLEHFYPHYEENAGHIAPEGNFRPTWYTQFRLASGSILYTIYENVKDLCLSTIYGSEGVLTMMHTGYPKTQEDAEELAKMIIKEHSKVSEGKVYCVTFHVEGDETKNTVNKDGERVQTKYYYYAYATCEEHARRIVESYDAQAVIESIEEEYDAISQRFEE